MAYELALLFDFSYHSGWSQVYFIHGFLLFLLDGVKCILFTAFYFSYCISAFRPLGLIPLRWAGEFHSSPVDSSVIRPVGVDPV